MAETPTTLAEFAGYGGRATSRLHGKPASTEVVILSASSARNAYDLAPDSHYRVVSDIDAYIKLGDGTVAATTSDMPIFAKVAVLVYSQTALRIAAIAGGAGKLYITKMEGA